MTRFHSAGAALAPLAFAALASAQLHLPPDPGPRIGIIRPVPPTVRLANLAVVVRIVDGIATTELRQTFANDGERPAEGTWILPLPHGATADQLTMKAGGQELSGEVLDAERARAIYEDIVRRQRDPALLEYVGAGCLRARAFPIPARSAVDVTVRYRQVLPATAGMHEWVFPWRALGAGGQPPEKLSLDLKINSAKAIKNVWTPVQGIDIVRTGDHEARASYECHDRRVPERDLVVFYGVADGNFGLDLLSWRKAGEPGFFLLMVSPSVEGGDSKGISRVLNFVIDTSGSMQGKKIEQARGALRFFVQSLRPHDWFNVVPFATEARPFFGAPVAASAANIEKALAMIAAIEARGGTNIEDGLRAALAPPLPQVEAGQTVVPITVFLTDGMPTVGATDTSELLTLTAKANAHGARIFVFGVGHDVNTHLLDRIAEKSRGDRDYVREDESIEVKTGALFTKLSHPVLTGVEIDLGVADAFELLPNQIPDLFKGSRLLIVGRYRRDGHHPIRLRGTVDGARREFVYEGTFTSGATQHDFVPVLWAERRIGLLLDAIRLNGARQELVDEVKRLGREYGIVTPYTSHLILEDGARVSDARGLAPGQRLGRLDEQRAQRVADELRRAGEARQFDDLVRRYRAELDAEAATETAAAGEKLAGLPSAPASGAAAVRDSTELYLLGHSARPGAAGDDTGVAGLASRRIKDRSFHLVDGVWVDAGFEAKMRDSVRKVSAFSDEYFALLTAHPELAACLAFSARIVIVVDGAAIEIV
jgi:Ca-activated chloride channel family protein